VIQTLLFGLRTVPFMEACARRYGDVFIVHIVGGAPSVWISDPAVIKQVYARDRDNLVPPQATPSLEPMFGLGSVFLADGAAHRRKRRLLMPPFHGERLAAWRDRMVAAAEREVDRWSAGSELVLAPRMTAITEDVIFEVVFGLGAGEGQARLRRSLTEMVAMGMRTAGVLLGFVDRESRLRRAPLTPWGRFQRAIDRTDALLY
jgi:cytochrome P450